MKQIREDLWQIEVFRPMPFLKTQSYFLKTNYGNALFYNTGHKAEIDEVELLGGIDTQYLSHRHESANNLKSIKERFNSTLVADCIEARFIRKDCKVDTFTEDGINFDDGVIPIITHGHTSGGSCYYYESSSRERYLFTGDLFYVDGNKFSTFVYGPDGGSNEELIKSLEKLKAFDPTLVLSSAFGGSSSALEVDKSFWLAEIERNIEALL